jgi:hypothetical protein
MSLDPYEGYVPLTKTPGSKIGYSVWRNNIRGYANRLGDIISEDAENYIVDQSQGDGEFYTEPTIRTFKKSDDGKKYMLLPPKPHKEAASAAREDSQAVKAVVTKPATYWSSIRADSAIRLKEEGQNKYLKYKQKYLKYKQKYINLKNSNAI